MDQTAIEKIRKETIDNIKKYDAIACESTSDFRVSVYGSLIKDRSIINGYYLN